MILRILSLQEPVRAKILNKTQPPEAPAYSATPKNLESTLPGGDIQHLKSGSFSRKNSLCQRHEAEAASPQTLSHWIPSRSVALRMVSSLWSGRWSDSFLKPYGGPNQHPRPDQGDRIKGQPEPKLAKPLQDSLSPCHFATWAGRRGGCAATCFNLASWRSFNTRDVFILVVSLFFGCIFRSAN